MENVKKVVIKMKKTEQSSTSTKEEEEKQLENGIEDKTTEEQSPKPTVQAHEDEEAVKQPKEDFGKMFDASNKDFTLIPGELIAGTIIEIRDDVVFVDINYKSEGKVDRSEFDNDEISIGDKCNVIVDSVKDSIGEVVLSKKNADAIVAKKELGKSFENGSIIQGKIKMDVKGGFIVDVGLDAFLPLSQLEIDKRITDEDKKDYIGQTFDFKVTKFEPQHKNVVISRRIHLEEEKKKLKEKFFSTIKEGNIVAGTIKNIQEYGVFVALDGLDGFIPIKELAWGHVKNCQDVITIGEKVKVKVIKINDEEQKVSLSLKDMTQDPWIDFVKNHAKDETISGEVIKLADFGVFVRIEDGVEGLLPISELSWTKRINHPKELLKKGDHVEVKIINMDVDNRKMSLSLRQIMPNPWDTVDELYPIGKKVKGTVKNITKFGAFIELDKNITGLLHQNDMAWTTKNVDQKKEIKRGADIDVVVLDINKEEKNISLGIKQLQDNPWVGFASENPKGSIIKGKVVKIINVGMFIKLTDQLEGFIHVSDASKVRVDDINTLFKVGDEVDAVITDINIQKSKVSLSIKDYDRRIEQLNIEKYVSKNEEEGTSVSLGDLIDRSKLD